MARGLRRTLLLPVSITSRDKVPLARQLADALREAVLKGQLKSGVRLPSTRALAAELGVSRNTALEAYAQLLSEGYFDGRVGSGTFVSAPPAQQMLRTHAKPQGELRRPIAALSLRGAHITSVRHSACGDELRPFNPGFPQLDPSTFEAWWRAAGRRHRRLTREMLSYGNAAGYPPLREAIAAYLWPSRGVRCVPEQVIVTAGTQQALALLAQVLLDPNDDVWIEDPGYSGARNAFGAAGGHLVPVPVDDEGFQIDVAARRAPRARLAYVSPSHQYPLGVTMSLSRRLRLIDWAVRTGAWVVEDDYDGEFRHRSRPQPTLQGLDRTDRVLYVGTFSKALFPALRIGYIVVPEHLVSAFQAAQAVAGHTVPTIDQTILSDFINDGHFTRHVQRMRKRYEALRTILEREVTARIGPALTITGAQVGLHVVGRLAPGLDEREVSRRAAAVGVTAPPLGAYHLGRPTISGVVLGYGHLDEASICDGVDRLASAVNASHRRPSRARE